MNKETAVKLTFNDLEGGDSFLIGTQYYIKIKQGKLAITDKGIAMNLNNGQIMTFAPNRQVERGINLKDTGEVFGVILNSSIAV